MDIKQARKTLGKDYEQLSDEQIQSILNFFQAFGTHVIDSTLSNTHEEDKDSSFFVGGGKN